MRISNLFLPVYHNICGTILAYLPKSTGSLWKTLHIIGCQLEQGLINGHHTKNTGKSNLFVVFLASSGRAKGSAVSGHVLETDG